MSDQTCVPLHTLRPGDVFRLHLVCGGEDVPLTLETIRHRGKRVLLATTDGVAWAESREREVRLVQRGQAAV